MGGAVFVKDITDKNNWLVLKLKSNQANVAANDLQARGIQYLHPIYKKMSGKVKNKWIPVPVYPGYIFIKPIKEDFASINYIRGSCGLLKIGNGIGCLRNTEVKSIIQMTSCNESLAFHKELLPGQKIRVLSGSLEGVVGEVIFVRGEKRIGIRTEFLGRSVSTVLNGALYHIL